MLIILNNYLILFKRIVIVIIFFIFDLVVNLIHTGDSCMKIVQQLKAMSYAELDLLARKLGIVGATLMSKDELVSRIEYAQEHPDEEIEITGVLEKLPDGFGFLRSARFDYVSSPDDVYVSPSQIPINWLTAIAGITLRFKISTCSHPLFVEITLGYCPLDFS